MHLLENMCMMYNSCMHVALFPHSSTQHNQIDNGKKMFYNGLRETKEVKKKKSKSWY